MANQNYKSNSNKGKKIVPVAILIILGIVLFIGGILYLREYKIGQSFAEYKVSFKTVGTLALGDPVRVSGVKIGKVTSIDLRYKNVLVNLHVDNKYQIPKDSKFYIRSMGIMGERMVTIILGESENRIVESEEYNGIYEPGIGEALGSIGHLLVKVDTMLTYIKDIVDSTIGKDNFANDFNEVIDEISIITSDISEIVHENKTKINRSIDNIDKITTNGDKLIVKLDKSVDKVMLEIDTLSSDGKVVMTDLKDITSTTKDIANKIDTGNGLASKIINDSNLATNVEGLVESVDTLIQKIDEKGIKIRFFGE